MNSIKMMCRPWLILLVLLGSACTSLPTAVPKISSQAFSSPTETSLGRLVAERIDEHPGRSGVQVLDTGRQALQVRLALLELAERAIDLQYYIWNSDYSGRLLAERVMLAADRGVRVRLLLDDFNVNEQDAQLMAMHAHPNIQVRIYNPNPNRSGPIKWLSLMGDFARLNQRMHNKSFVVDASMAIVGGRNLGDEYFDIGETINFRDRELLAAGPVVRDLAQGFDSFWNSERSYPVDAIVSSRLSQNQIQVMTNEWRTLRQDQPIPAYPLPMDRAGSLALLEEWGETLLWACTRVLIDRAPGLSEIDSERQQRLALELTELATQVESEVLIESAYLVLGDPGAELLEGLTDRGIRVRALTNSLATNDLVTNHSAYARRRPQMLKSGIELYELRPDAESCGSTIGSADWCATDNLYGLHAKSIVFDRSKVFVGSFNLNLRSVYLNSELGLVVESPELAQQIADDIERNMRRENSWRVELDESGAPLWIGWENDAQIHYSHEPKSGFWRRLKSSLLSILPIEKYL
ncbi:MAG: phospholipase D family protein [Gammaproteobacteria bacterium]|nr:phospholipase D family protein [Gammaproteobacteria bacterium]